ncbi:hypothetical protein M407DRAFT_242863 [Tulasnella calospora MUT 4182]|uniref:Uncharacterized protein n=1 Tax=Tulasnella calospora MUT 4182 TaxID=1051891 RepID=A0A0C3QNR9_9AGAM|nr:hypothetical protein M407DRAFT_242863 [Tulasnella calospora MUT 4182]
MADYAVSCFADDALEWSISVDRDVLEDWDVLQRALMQEYCRYRVSSVEGSGAARTTTDTAPPAAAPAAPGVTPTTNASTMTGFIRIVAETPEAGNYMSKKVDPHYGVLLTCTELGDAARVRLSSYGIQFVDFPEPYCWLGIIITESSAKNGQIGRESFGNLCPTSAPTSHVMGTSVKDIAGPARSNIWLFQSLDSCIVSTWSSVDYTYILQPVVNLGNNRLLAATNYPKFTKNNSQNNYAKARLIFEPV